MILKRKIIVYESVVQIKANVKRATFIQDISSKQEIDFEVFYSNIDVKNPLDEIKIVIQQNDNWKSVKQNIQPTFITSNKLSNHVGTNMYKAVIMIMFGGLAPTI